MSYPGSLPAVGSFTMSSTGTLGAQSHSTVHNSLATEVVAIATELGTNPKSSFASVAERLTSMAASITVNTAAVLAGDYVSGFTIGTIQITTASITNLTVSNLTVTGESSTWERISNLTVGTANITTATITNATVTSLIITAAIPNVTATSLTVINAVANLTVTTLKVVSAVPNVTITALSLTNAVANLTATSLSVTGAIANVTATALTCAGGDVNPAVKRIVEITSIGAATGLAAATGSAYFFVPSDLNGFSLTDADACVNVTCSGGTVEVGVFHINNNVKMLTTNVYIDTLEKTSFTALTASVIGAGTCASVATGDEIRIDLHQIGTVSASGLSTILVFTK